MSRFMSPLLLLALLAGVAAAEAGCGIDEEDCPGVYLVQTDRRAVKAAPKPPSEARTHPSPLADAHPREADLERKFGKTPFLDPDLVKWEKTLKKYVPWLLAYPSPRLQLTRTGVDLEVLPLEAVPSQEEHSRMRMNHNRASVATNVKICLSTPFILYLCYWITIRLKSRRAARTSAAPKFDPSSIYVMCLIATVGGTMIITLKPYIALDFGASAGMVGLLQSSFSITQFFGTLTMGWLSDKFGRKRLLLTLPIGHIVAHLGCAMSASYTPFLLSRLLLGLFGGLVPISEALIAENVPKEECAGALGKLMAFLGLGVVLGPAIASLLAPLGTSNIFYITALLALVIWIWLLWSFDDSWKGAFPSAERALTETTTAMEDSAGTPHKLNWGMLVFWYAFVILSQSGSTTSLSMLPLYFLDVYGIEEQTMGIMFMCAGISLMVAQGTLSGVVTKKFGELGAVIMGVAGGAMAMALLLLVQSPAMPWILVVFSTAMGAFTDPSSCAAVSNLSTEKNRGTLLGIYQALRALGQGIGPILGGFLYEITMLLPFYVSMMNSLCLTAVCSAFLCAARRYRTSEESYEAKPGTEAEAKIAK